MKAVFFVSRNPISLTPVIPLRMENTAAALTMQDFEARMNWYGSVCSRADRLSFA